jgi:hypothetical protein
MSDMLEHTIKTAVATWLAAQLNITEVVSYVFPDEDEADRYIVVFATKSQDMWRAVEAWVENDAVVDINDLGEGVPPDGVAWPWD